MKCKITYKLNRFIDGELNEFESQMIKDHLKECKVCAVEYDKIITINNMICDTDEFDCPDHLIDNVMSKVNSSKVISFPSQNLKLKILPIAASFLISFLIGSIVSLSVLNTNNSETDDFSFGSESFAYYFEGVEK